MWAAYNWLSEMEDLDIFTEEEQKLLFDSTDTLYKVCLSVSERHRALEGTIKSSLPDRDDEGESE